METIEQIIKMDKAAESRVREAVEREKELLSRSGEQALLQSRAELEAERNEAEAIVREAQQKLDEKLKLAEKERIEQCGRLDAIFDEHRQQWKAEILSRITGG